MNKGRLHITLLCSIFLQLNLLEAQIVFTYTSEGSLLTFDSDTLEQLSGIAPTSHGASMDLTFDNTGRLFGEFQDDIGGHIVEYDPVSLSILNESIISSGITGLAARNGILYTFEILRLFYRNPLTGELKENTWTVIAARRLCVGQIDQFEKFPPGSAIDLINGLDFHHYAAI